MSIHVHTIIHSRVFRSIIAILLVVTFSVPIIPYPVSAQQYFADISMELNPDFPKVGDLTTVRVVSSDVNLEFQSISWYVNDELKLSGKAKTSIVFTIEPDISQYTVRAVIGERPSQVVRELSFAPGEVIMLWEAVDSYVPRWYKGKALMPAEGTVRITAVPVGAPSLDKLFFVWKQGYNGLGVQSGYGKNSIVLTNTVFLDTLDVSVEVSSADRSYLSRGELSIPRSKADVRLVSTPASGIPSFEQGGILNVFGNNATIEALPYNLPTRSAESGLIFDWLLNGVQYQHDPAQAQNIIYIANPNAPIRADITVQSYQHLLQEFKAQKSILFN